MTKYRQAQAPTRHAPDRVILSATTATARIDFQCINSVGADVLERVLRSYTTSIIIRRPP